MSNVNYFLNQIIFKKNDYDTLAASYDKFSDNIGYADPIVVSKYFETVVNLPKDALILDIGCGTGKLGKHLKEIHNVSNRLNFGIW